MRRLTKAIEALFHRHEFFQVIGTSEPCGVTLGWDMRPTTEYRILERCRCGDERWSRGWQLPRSVEARATAIRARMEQNG